MSDGPETQLRQDVKEFFNFKTSDLSPECNCHQEFRVHICFVHEGPEMMNKIKGIGDASVVSDTAQKVRRAQLEARTGHQMVEVLIESPEHYERLTGKPHAMADQAIRFAFHPSDCKECGE